MSYFVDVKGFHRTFGLVVNDEPIDFSHENLDLDDAQLFNLRETLMEEEWKELMTAWYGEDLVEVADAICDLIYVLCGTAVSLGIPLDACWKEVHRSNMSKLAEDGKAIKREDGKILKGPNFIEPDLRTVIYAPTG